MSTFFMCLYVLKHLYIIHLNFKYVLIFKVTILYMDFLKFNGIVFL